MHDVGAYLTNLSIWTDSHAKSRALVLLSWEALESEVDMRMGLKMLLGVAGIAVATQAGAQITFYEGEGYLGRFVTANGPIPDLGLYQFDDRAASASITNGRWEACSQPSFQGRCVVLQPGNYPSLASMEMRRGISSVRPVSEATLGYQAPAAVVVAPATTYVTPAVTAVNVTPAATAVNVNPADQVLQARVISVQPIAGPPQQHCWTEQKQIGPLELPSAILNGTGDLLAGKPQGLPYVQRCETVPGTASGFDVTYEFQGVERHAQMNTPPSGTISVNGYGQPRG
jgi:beta/gamma crystallin